MNDCCCDSHSPILTCDRATLGYENQIVIKDLAFEIYPGDYLSIIGENGSGKTTLMKSMLGLKAKVTLVAPKSITRSEGKAVRVIDNRKI